MLQENVEFTFSKSYLKGLQAPMQFYILPNNSTKKRATAKNPCLNLCSFRCHSHQKKIFVFKNTCAFSLSLSNIFVDSLVFSDFMSTFLSFVFA